MNRTTPALLLALAAAGLAGAQTSAAGQTPASGVHLTPATKGTMPVAPATKAAMPMAQAGCAKTLRAKVNLNKAPLAELECLKGVTATTAKDIIANRPYKNGADFSRKIEVIGRRLFANNKASVVF